MRPNNSCLAASKALDAPPSRRRVELDWQERLVHCTKVARLGSARLGSARLGLEPAPSRRRQLGPEMRTKLAPLAGQGHTPTHVRWAGAPHVPLSRAVLAVGATGPVGPKNWRQPTALAYLEPASDRHSAARLTRARRPRANRRPPSEGQADRDFSNSEAASSVIGPASCWPPINAETVRLSL